MRALTRVIALFLAPLRGVDQRIVAGGLANAHAELNRIELRRQLTASIGSEALEEAPISA
jgi:hypothetical protein